MILVAQSSRKHVLTRLFVEVRLHLQQIPDEPAHEARSLSEEDERFKPDGDDDHLENSITDVKFKWATKTNLWEMATKYEGGLAWGPAGKLLQDLGMPPLHKFTIKFFTQGKSILEKK